MFWKIYIYGARAIFLLFCDHQDTESEQREKEIGFAQPILTKKEPSKALMENNIHTLQYGRIILAIIHIHEARAIFYYFVITKTFNLSHKKWKLVYQD